MKKLILIPMAILLLNSCSSNNGINPSQNSSLNKITKSKTIKTDGAMQKSLDNWLKKEWKPTINKNKRFKKLDENKSRNFTLQEYIDKAILYGKTHNKQTKNSHLEKLKKLPAINQ